MSDIKFPTLFSSIDIGSVTIPNRIVSTGHHTYLAHEIPSKELIALTFTLPFAVCRFGIALVVFI